MIGRQRPFSALRRALAATIAGSGDCLLIEGTPGIGKTRLLEALKEEALKRGTSLAAGSATQLDRVAPLSTLMTPLRPILRRHPSLPEVADANRLQQVESIREALEQHTREQPLVIVLDDVHWADEFSVLALRMLVPALASSPLLWLIARRPVAVRDEIQASIDSLVRDPHRRLELGPLSATAVAKLCTSVLGAEPDACLRALVQRCAGNPFVLEELLCRLQQTEKVRIIDGVAVLEEGGPALPVDFLNAVDQRLCNLSPDAVRLLEAGAVFGRPFTLHEAAGLLQRPAASMMSATEEAIEFGNLVEDDVTLTFRHDLIREAVYQHLAPPVRAALHREAATVLSEEGRSAAEVAEHLIRSGDRGDARVLEVLLDAVEQVAPTAPATAADLILKMLDLLQADECIRPDFIAKAVNLLATAGRIEEARELAEAALSAGLQGSCEAAVLLGLAEALKLTGQNEQVVALTTRALKGSDVPAATRAALRALQAHALLHCADLRTAGRVAVSAAELAEESNAYSALVLAKVAQSSVARAQGHLELSLEHAQEAVTIADSKGGDTRHRHPRLWLLSVLIALDRFTDAHSVYRLGRREAQQLGTAWSEPLWHYYHTMLRFGEGKLDDAAAEARAGVHVTEHLSALALGVPLLALLGRLELERGDIASARRHVQRAERLEQEGVSAGPETLVWTRALLEDAALESEIAVGTLAALYDSLDARPLLLTHDPSAGPQLMHIAKRAGAPELGKRVVVAAHELAKRNPQVPSLVAASAHTEGLLHDDVDALRHALALYRTSPRVLARAAALEDLAKAEDAAGDRHAATTLFDEALQDYERLGAERSSARVQRELRARGVRRKCWRRKWKGFAANNLTESEWRVARLVAHGFTNREVADQLFLSPHTVDSHLRHSFTKLGVNSRVELTRRILVPEKDNPEKT